MNGTTTQYHYAGGKLSDVVKGSTSLHISYDELGPWFVYYNNGTATTVHYFLRNAQGDVLGLVNAHGVVVVSYTYDAWGNVLSTTGSMANTLGALNPLRYRGYVYDTETGLYYLNSRYYNPSWGRFINADVFVSTGQGVLGSNMFAYCNNNPVNMIDSNGHVPSYNVAMTDGGDGSSNSAVYAAYLLHKYPHPSLGKMLASAAGCAFLEATGLKATKATYYNGIWGDRALLPEAGEAEVIRALRGSVQMNAKIRDAVQCADGSNFIVSGTVNFEWDSTKEGQDLYLSIHSASYTLQGKKSGSNWIVTVDLWDPYNFEYWGKEGHPFLGRAVNNFGLYLQENGVIDPYYLHVTYKVIWR